MLIIQAIVCKHTGWADVPTPRQMVATARMRALQLAAAGGSLALIVPACILRDRWFVFAILPILLA